MYVLIFRQVAARTDGFPQLVVWLGVRQLVHAVVLDILKEKHPPEQLLYAGVLGAWSRVSCNSSGELTDVQDIYG